MLLDWHGFVVVPVKRNILNCVRISEFSELRVITCYNKYAVLERSTDIQVSDIHKPAVENFKRGLPT